MLGISTKPVAKDEEQDGDHRMFILTTLDWSLDIVVPEYEFIVDLHDSAGR
ncbi:MAG: hypothetical protein MPJ50_14165 [Pirellulales bacterium]|nr:hypothetical protein [Pirellulales bacterium]